MFGAKQRLLDASLMPRPKADQLAEKGLTTFWTFYRKEDLVIIVTIQRVSARNDLSFSLAGVNNIAKNSARRRAGASRC